jgi:hypothetical protein
MSKTSVPHRPRAPLTLAPTPALPGTAVTDLTVSVLRNLTDEPVTIAGETLARAVYFLESLDDMEWLKAHPSDIAGLELEGVEEVLYHLGHSQDSVKGEAFDAVSRYVGVIRARLIVCDTTREFLAQRYRLVAGGAEARA